MERLKYEDRFKKELKGREITPSGGSWEKLRDRLDAEEHRSVRSWWWTGIAASVAAGIVIAALVFSGKETEVVPQVVDSPAQEVIQEDSGRDEYTEGKITEHFSPATEKKNPAVAERKEQSERQKQSAGSVAQTVPGTGKAGSTDNQVILREQEVGMPEDIRISEVSAPLEASREVSDAEIDALLRKATLQISTERSEEIVRGIDAGDLLRDVESELEQSFRKKVLEVLQDGFSRAKNAVANRNL